MHVCVRVKAKACRSTIHPLQTLTAQLKSVQVKMQIKSEINKAFQKTNEEMKNAIREVEDFLSKAMVDLARADTLEQGGDTVAATSTALQAMVTTAEHHLLGARIAKKRYDGMVALKA